MSKADEVMGELRVIGAIGPVQGRMSKPAGEEEPETQGPLDEAKLRSLCATAIERLDQIESVVQDLKGAFKGIVESQAPQQEEEESDAGT